MSTQCGPCLLKKGNYSVPIKWFILHKLTEDYAIFKHWPTEQDRIATTHLLEMPDIKWTKVEHGLHYMSREQYDLNNDQV